MDESPVGRVCCDAKVLEVGEGTFEIQRQIIARQLGISPRTALPLSVNSLMPRGVHHGG